MDASKGNQYLVPSSISPALPSATGFPINNSSSQVWSTGLCDCTEDVGNCCMTCWCPWVTFGQIADIVDRASPSCGASGALYALISCITGCHCIYSHFYRSKLRMQYGLPGTPSSDLLVDCFCEPCALCQSYRELKNRGYDMSIGWHANMERQGNAAVQPPPVQGRMMR